MKEIEILVPVLDEKKKVLRVLRRFEFKSVKQTRDIFFFDPQRNNLQIKNNKYPKEWFRIRLKGDKSYMTYKKDIFDKDEKWLYSHEHETEVGDFFKLKQIIEKLGYAKLVEINTKKHIFITKEYEIIFEEVQNLGNFLEVEKLNVKERANVKKIRKEIQQFIDGLDFCVGPELNIGKPELMLRERNSKL